MLADILAWGLSFALTARAHVPLPNVLVLLLLWLVWFGVLRRRYQRRQPFWSELLGLIKGCGAFMALNLLASLLAAQPLP